LCLGWALLGLVTSLGWLPAGAWVAAGACCALAIAVDAWRVGRHGLPTVARTVPEVLPLGMTRDVALELTTPRALRVDVHDLHPVGWQATGLPVALRLSPDSATQVRYPLQPTARGDFTFAGVHLRLHSPWRLWRRAVVAGGTQPVRVYPNFAPLARLALLGAESASRLVGAHLRRRRGEGTDFHQMRDYRVGDSMRQVDWKATARMRRLISREYQDERNQQLLLVVDTGRRMLARDGELAHFDHALDAALVVGYLALRQGDAVGLLATGGAQRWVAPQRGLGAIDVLLRASYDLEPAPVATDYLAAATELALRQRRRALVMLVTNLRDEDIEDVLVAVRLLQKRHHVVVASLREQAVDAALADAPESLPDALRAAAAARYLDQRAAAHDALRQHRVTVLDVTCGELAGALTERYLAIKRDGLL
jgi:uncharacterized protein (DUF58 family)